MELPKKFWEEEGGMPQGEMKNHDLMPKPGLEYSSIVKMRSQGS